MAKFMSGRSLCALGMTLTSAIVLGVPQSAQAGLLAEETFSSYATGGEFRTVPGGSGWSGAWDVGAPGQGYLNEVRNNANDFSYPNYTAATTPEISSGNHLNLAAGFGGPGFNYVERFLDTSAGGSFDAAGLLATNGASQTAIGADGTSVWGSFLYQGASDGLQLWLRNPGVADAQFALPNAGSSTALVVFRIDYLAGNDNITFWNSPSLSTWTAASTPSATASGDYAFNKLILVEGQNDSEGRFDDIRFGTAAADVIPVPEPAGIAVLALAMAGLARRHRRCA